MKSPLVLFAAALLSGCAATINAPTSTASAPAAVPIATPPQTAKLLVVVTPSPQLKNREDWADFQLTWRESLATVSSQQTFEATLLDQEPAALPPAALLARVTVNDYRYVSQAKRYGLGIMTGNASMDLDVDFLAPPGKRSLGTRKFSSASSAWQGVFSAMTPKQVEAVATELVKQAKPQ